MYVIHILLHSGIAYWPLNESHKVMLAYELISFIFIYYTYTDNSCPCAKQLEGGGEGGCWVLLMSSCMKKSLFQPP